MKNKPEELYINLHMYCKTKLNFSIWQTACLISNWRDLVNIGCKIEPKNVHVIIAGGYDERVSENVEYHFELNELAQKLKVFIFFKVHLFTYIMIYFSRFNCVMIFNIF